MTADTSLTDLSAAAESLGYQNTMYAEWVTVPLAEQKRPALLHNWSEEDLVAFCGGKFATNYYAKKVYND